MSNRTSTLEDLEVEYREAVEAREKAAERRQELEAERERIASNGVTGAKLRDLREKLAEAEEEFRDADAAVERVLPDLALMREAVDAERQRQRAVEQAEREVAGYAAQIEAARAIAGIYPALQEAANRGYLYDAIGRAWRGIRDTRWEDELARFEQLHDQAQAKLKRLRKEAS